MKRLPLFLIFSLLLFTTCVEPVNVDFGEPVKRLVVDGIISTKPGPYTVKLTTTAKYTTGSDGTNYLVKGAKVTISDDTGYSEQLTEVSSGFYQTSPSGIQGQVGRTYTLRIETEGNTYESKPELLSATTGIDKIYTEFKYEAPGVEEGFYVYIDTQDPAGTEDFYRWDWVHYEPELICYNQLDPPATVPTVLDCCTRCWNIIRCNGCVNIASDLYTNGSTISRQLLAFVPYTARTKYFLYYEQQSLSKEAYKFWKGLERQANSVGGIFDAPPSIIRGNIVNVNNPDDIVLGFFSATDIKPGFINVDRSGIDKPPTGPPPVQKPPMNGPPPPCYPCLESIVRTAITPPLWQD